MVAQQVVVLVFLVTSLARLMRARRMRLQGKPKSKYVMQRVYALAFLVCAVLPFFLPYYKEAGFWANATGKPVGWCGDVRQAVGLVFLMAQCGLYVPADSCSLSPADCIYTHFPADENKTVDLGRLGEESRRLSEIFAKASDESLLLFNESLATTSFAEGLYIAKDVTKALRYLGARTIFNTHMHELAMSAKEVNEQIEGDMKVASLITGIHEGKRSFKIFIAPPEGVSYAQDIAKKYGVTIDQLMKTIKR